MLKCTAEGSGIGRIPDHPTASEGVHARQIRWDCLLLRLGSESESRAHYYDGVRSFIGAAKEQILYQVHRRGEWKVESAAYAPSIRLLAKGPKILLVRLDSDSKSRAHYYDVLRSLVWVA